MHTSRHLIIGICLNYRSLLMVKMHERKDFSLLHAARSVADQNPEVVSITLFDSMFRSLSAEGSVQSIQDNVTLEYVRSAFAQRDIDVSDSNGVVSER